MRPIRHIYLGLAALATMLGRLLDVSTSTSGQNNTIIFPLPMDLIKPLLDKVDPKS